MDEANNISKRTSHRELPTGAEIAALAAKEMQRPHAPGKDGVRYVDFSSIVDLLHYLGLPVSFFDDNYERSAAELLDDGALLLEQIIGLLTARDLIDRETDLLRAAYEYLSETDVPVPSDLIFVFGARTPLRIEAGIELYRRDLAPRLLVSGHGPFYGESEGESEAARYAKIAYNAGISDEMILIEDESITVVDNIRRSLQLLETKMIQHDSIIIVNSPYTQRRGWCMWRKYVPDTTKLYRVNCATGPDFTREYWYRNETGLRVILGEFIKLRAAVAFDDA